MIHEYPYTDFHEINLDWIIRRVKYLNQLVDEYIEKTKKLQADVDYVKSFVETLKEIIAELQAELDDIEKLKEDMKQAKDDIFELQTQVATLTNNVMLLSTNVANLSAQVADAVETVAAMESTVNLLVNTVEELQEFSNQLEERVGENEVKIGNLNLRIAQAEGDITGVVTKNDQQDTRIGELESSVGSIENDITDLKAKDTVLQGDINALDVQVEVLKEKDTTQDARLDAVESNVGQVEGNLSTLTLRVETTENDINSLTTRVDTTESNIISLITDVETAEGNIDSLTTRVGTAESDITTLKAAIENFNANGNRIWFSNWLDSGSWRITGTKYDSEPAIGDILIIDPSIDTGYTERYQIQIASGDNAYGPYYVYDNGSMINSIYAWTKYIPRAFVFSQKSGAIGLVLKPITHLSLTTDLLDDMVKNHYGMLGSSYTITPYTLEYLLNQQTTSNMRNKYKNLLPTSTFNAQTIRLNDIRERTFALSITFRVNNTSEYTHNEIFIITDGTYNISRQVTICTSYQNNPYLSFRNVQVACSLEEDVDRYINITFANAEHGSYGSMNINNDILIPYLIDVYQMGNGILD